MQGGVGEGECFKAGSYISPLQGSLLHTQIRNHRLWNPGTQVGKRLKFLVMTKKSLHVVLFHGMENMEVHTYREVCSGFTAHSGG